MPLITCPDCKNEMSDSAPSCPKCGKPNTNTTSRHRSVGILLGLGIFLIPMIFAWFTLRKGHTTKSRIFSFLWLAVMVIGIGSQDGHKSNNNSVSQIKSSSNLPSRVTEPAMKVDIGDILSSYKNNEIGADNRYKGKRIQVTGIVNEVKKDMLNNLYVTLGTGAQFEIPQIQAFFDDSMNNELAQLNKNDRLTVVCRVDGLMMNVLLKDCGIK